MSSFSKFDAQSDSSSPVGCLAAAPRSRCGCLRTRPRKITCLICTILSLAALGVIIWIIAKVVALRQYALPQAA